MLNQPDKMRDPVIFRYFGSKQRILTIYLYVLTPHLHLILDQMGELPYRKQQPEYSLLFLQPNTDLLLMHEIIVVELIGV